MKRAPIEERRDGKVSGRASIEEKRDGNAMKRAWIEGNRDRRSKNALVGRSDRLGSLENAL